MVTALTLEEWYFISQIVSVVANIFLVAVSTTIAIYVYRWQKQAARVETSRRLQEDLRHFNELILNNEELQKLAVETHPWGKITAADVVQMYRYFIYLNIAVSTFDAKIRKAIDEETYESQINNVANITYKDREFIKQHVLPRGYTLKFRRELLARWERIDENGVLLSI